MSRARLAAVSVGAAAFLLVHVLPVLLSPDEGIAVLASDGIGRWRAVATVALAAAIAAAVAARLGGGTAGAVGAAAGLVASPWVVDAVASPAAAWPRVLLLPAAAATLLMVPRGAPFGVRVNAPCVVAGLVWLWSLRDGGTSCPSIEPREGRALVGAAVGGLLAAAVAAPGSVRPRGLRLAGTGLLVAGLALGVLEGTRRAAAWTDAALFWNVAAARSPRSPLAHAGAAAAAARDGDLAAAGRHLTAFAAVVRSGAGVGIRDGAARTAAVDRAARAVTAIARSRGGTPTGDAPDPGAESVVGAADAALLLEPGHAGALAARGEALLAAGDAVLATTALAEATATLHDDGDLHDALARALLATGRIDEAVRAATTAIGIRPTSAPFVATFARALAEAGRGPDAVTALHRALAAAPRDATLLRAWGDVHLRLAYRRLTEGGAARGKARRLLLTGLRLDPGNRAAAEELARLDALREAERPAAEALLAPDADGTVAPDRAVLYAGWLGRWGDFEAAAPVWARLLRGRDGDANLHFQMGLEFQEARETVEGHEEAVRLYRKALVLDAGLADARDRLWRALLNLGRLEEARGEAARFAREFPAHPGAVEAERIAAPPSRGSPGEGAGAAPADAAAIRVRLLRAERNLALHGVTMNPRHLGNALADYVPVLEALEREDRPPGMDSDEEWLDATMTAAFSVAFCLARDEIPGDDRRPVVIARIESALERAARIRPDFFALWIVDGMFHERMGNSEHAVRSLDTGLRLLEDARGLVPWQTYQLRLFGLMARGRAHMARTVGREDLAVADFRAAAELAAAAVRGPDVPREGSRLEVYVLTHLAAAQMEMDQYADARSTLERLLREDPGDARHAYHLAVVSHREERYDDALRLYAQAARMDSRDPRPHIKSAYILLHPGRATPDPAGALARAEVYRNLTAGRGDPRLPDEYCACRGEALRMLGRTAEAEQWLRRALELNPRCKRAMQALITILQAEGSRSPDREEELRSMARRLQEENRLRQTGEGMEVDRGDQTFCLAPRAPRPAPHRGAHEGTCDFAPGPDPTRGLSS